MMAVLSIKLYLCIARVEDRSKKTPKYTEIGRFGDYPPFEDLRGRDGKVSMYLKEHYSKSGNAPALNLQAKNSLNFTGVQWHCGVVGGRYAYGEPNRNPYYSKERRPNPFADYWDDGYLMQFTYRDGDPLPRYIEIMVIDRARELVKGLCNRMAAGWYVRTFAALRERAALFGTMQPVTVQVGHSEPTGQDTEAARRGIVADYHNGGQYRTPRAEEGTDY